MAILPLNAERRSIFAMFSRRGSKWIVAAVWLIGIFIAAGPAQLPAKFTEAENNESTSFLPGDAESTKALTASEDLQGAELAPAVIVYRRDAGLTDADRRRIGGDARRLTERRYPGVVADGPTRPQGDARDLLEVRAPGAGGRPRAPTCRRAAARSPPLFPASPPITGRS